MRLLRIGSLKKSFFYSMPIKAESNTLELTLTVLGLNRCTYELLMAG